MITYFAKYDDMGRYTWFGTAESPVSGPGVHVGMVSIDRQYHDLQTNMPVDMPPRPSAAHEFDYATKQWALNQVAAWMEIRIKRDRILKDSDWMVTKAMETGEPMPPGWATYRQALRDITSQPDPENITWPAPPA